MVSGVAILPKSSLHQNAPSKTGAMALYSLVSRNVFNQSSSSDFFLSLLPFFEPYISSASGDLFDLDGLLEYSRSEIFMPISRDVGEIFAKRMVDVKWLRRETGSQQGVIYRVVHDSDNTIDHNSDVDKDLSHIIYNIIDFAQDRFSIRLDLTIVDLEDRLLSFLVRTASSREDELLSTAPSSDALSTERADYIFSRYISHIENKEAAVFDKIAKITGVALLAEALSEIRNPLLTISRADTELTVFLDGPFAMDYLGVSGTIAAESASFTIDRLKSLNVVVSILKSSCEEIRSNLQGLFGTPPLHRHGLTNTALIRGEVTEDECRLIMNNPELAFKKIKKITVLPHNPAMFRQNENYCPDDDISELADLMPSSNEAARRRDAEALGIVMRRRAGHSTEQIFRSKFIFLTSNDAVVTASNKFLRGKGLLSPDKMTYGPALHQRTLAGLLFANVGLVERVEVSRSTVLSACARTAMLRPKLLEQMKEQLKGVSSIQNDDILEALLLQPRGGEIIMDFTIGAAHTVSIRNREELAEALRRGLTQDLEEKHKREIDNIKIQSKEDSDKWASEVSKRDEALSTIQTQLQNINNTITASNERFDQIATAVALSEIRRVSRIELFVTVALAIVSVVVFCAPLMFKTGLIYGLTAWITAVLSAIGFVALVVNRQLNFLDGRLQHLAEKRVGAALGRQGLEEYVSRTRIDYRLGTATLAK
jgi:hypothetical protein